MQSKRLKIIDIIENGVNDYFTGELIVMTPALNYFSVYIQTIFNRGKVLGRIVSFNNVSEYRNLLEELAIAKERNRIAVDMHDTLGHTMILLITLMTVSKIFCNKNPQEAEEKLFESIKIAREGLKELRRSISGLKSQRLEDNGLVSALEELLQNFRFSGIKVEFSVEGLEYLEHKTNTKYSDTVYRICKESLTNSMRHSKAKNANIFLKVDNGDIKLFIFDDGQGCNDIKKNTGLTAMEERVNVLNGTIAYGSGGGKGFNISVRIPYGVE